SCVDVLRGQVLFDLAEAVERDDPAKYAKALATFGGSTSCMSLMADLKLGADLLVAHERAIERFAESKRGDARRALVSSLANVFMLIQDDVKHVGLNHAHYWLTQNRDELVRAFNRSWSVPRRTGLWFKDETGTRLEPIRPMCESGARDCASATGLLDAMIDGKRIGLGICDALELASMPWNPSEGYSCDRGLCAGDDGAALKGLERMSDQSVPFIPAPRPQGYPAGFTLSAMECRSGMCPKKGYTRYGTDVSSLQGSSCTNENTSSDGSGGGTFNPKKCAQSLLAASAKGRTLAKMECANEATKPTADMMLGLDAWPRDACTASAAADTGKKDDDEKFEKAKEDAQKWMLDNRQKIQDTAKKESKYKVKEGDVAKGTVAIGDAEPVDDENYFLRHNRDPKDGCRNSSACFNAKTGKIEVPNETIRTNSPEELAKVLEHEGVHAALYSTQDKRDQKYVDSGKESLKTERQHRVTCSLGIYGGPSGCPGNKFCGPDQNCDECGPGTAQRRALWACLGFDQTTGGPGEADRTTTIINPGPNSVSDTGDSLLGACFGNSSGGVSFPMECAALDCLDGQVPTLVTQQEVQVCKCSTDTARVGRGGTDTCAQIQCGPNERPVMTPNGCGCAPADGEGPRPVRPSPTPWPSGF
ncbi:MAG: hypothetical protein HY698_03115, partial [Deltaproteobacteria bacterium]|nr:hypothetical protein [Deltaproteobacteria bacterium]